MNDEIGIVVFIAIIIISILGQICLILLGIFSSKVLRKVKVRNKEHYFKILIVGLYIPSLVIGMFIGPFLILMFILVGMELEIVLFASISISLILFLLNIIAILINILLISRSDKQMEFIFGKEINQ